MRACTSSRLRKKIRRYREPFHWQCRWKLNSHFVLDAGQGAAETAFTCQGAEVGGELSTRPPIWVVGLRLDKALFMMHYYNPFLMCLRVASFLFCSSDQKDFRLGGKRLIPKDAVMLILGYHAQLDPDLWEEGDGARPVEEFWPSASLIFVPSLRRPPRMI